jgi:hypothetical protein
MPDSLNRFHITLIIKIDAPDEQTAAERGWAIASDVQADNADVPVTSVQRVD